MTSPTLIRDRRDYLVSNRNDLQCGNGWPNRRSVPYHSPRPACPEGDLCKDCEYALHVMIWPLDVHERREIKGPHDIVGRLEQDTCLGWVDGMAATDKCPFCSFLLRLFLSIHPTITKDQLIDERVDGRYCCWLGGPWRYTASDYDPTPDHWDWDCWVRFPKTSDTAVGPDEFVPPDLSTFSPRAEFRLDITCKDSAVKLFGNHGKGATLRGLAREIPGLWNAALFRDALQSCYDHHGSTCERPVTALHNLGRDGDQVESKFIPVINNALRVVDVREMRITNLPNGENYAALSYCWSKVPFVMLESTNVFELQQINSLQSVCLAPTLLDAIRTTSDLGVRYIWIDSLCIIQDDNDDKALQLRQMDSVYRQASITIIAAASVAESRDDGLPGVRQALTRGNLAAVELRGLIFRETPAFLTNVVRSSRWNSRAWTFQEYYLSKRLLISTPEQVYFQCRQRRLDETFVEHVCMEAKEIQDQAMDPCCDLATTTRMGATINSNASYEGTVAEYTLRQMSYDSDGLNAVRGMLHLLHKEHDVNFVCGLPTEHLFGHFLLWCSSGDSTRRQSTPGKSLFPSWCWAGWQGMAAYVQRPSRHDSAFTAQGIRINIDEEITDWQIKTSKDSMPVHPSDLGELIMDIDHCFLTFRAETSNQFEFHERPYGTPAGFRNYGGTYGDSRYAFSPPVGHNIVIKGKHAGCLIPDEGVTTIVKKSDSMFIALSWGKGHWQMWYPIIKNRPDNHWNRYVQDGEGGRPHVPFDRQIWDVGGQVVNVLLVYWEDGIAYRAGVGQIHADAWKLADRERMEILLG